MILPFLPVVGVLGGSVTTIVGSCLLLAEKSSVGARRLVTDHDACGRLRLNAAATMAMTRRTTVATVITLREEEFRESMSKR